MRQIAFVLQNFVFKDEMAVKYPPNVLSYNSMVLMSVIESRAKDDRNPGCEMSRAAKCLWHPFGALGYSVADPSLFAKPPVVEHRGAFWWERDPEPDGRFIKLEIREGGTNQLPQAR